MLPTGFVAVAILIRLMAGAGYIVAMLRGKARPHLVSWFFWGFTAIVAFIIEMHRHAGASAFVTLAIGASPIVVFSLGLIKGIHQTSYTRADNVCIALTVVGIVAWILTRQPLLALLASIAVDIASSTPTVIKCYKFPSSEHIVPYLLSMLSMVITLLTIRHWDPGAWLFPAYIFCINLTFVVMITAGKIGQPNKRPAYARARQTKRPARRNVRQRTA